jgi:hypothetical protein
LLGKCFPPVFVRGLRRPAILLGHVAVWLDAMSDLRAQGEGQAHRAFRGDLPRIRRNGLDLGAAQVDQ